MKTEMNKTQSLYMKTIFDSANSLLTLLNDILDFSKIEAGKLELNINLVNIRELIQQSINIVIFQKKDKPINLFTNIPESVSHFLSIDGFRIRQILINLLSNALKFTNSGEIELGVTEERLSESERESIFTFYVRDTGKGISIENQEKIFLAFSQEDSSISRKYGGSGLGLSISNNLLKLMNSKLELESIPGKGSKFHFKLKAKTENQTLSELNSNLNILDFTEYSSNLKNNFSILIVDDIPVNSNLAKAILKQLLPASQMHLASNGKQAIELYKLYKPDIIFMDIQMPEMNGYEATLEIRKLKDSEKIPIIALTAGTVKEEIEKCFQSGMNDFVMKPIVKETFKTLLEKWLKIKFQ